jgi:hypothetical protein
MNLTQARVGNPFRRRWKFVPVLLTYDGGKGLWTETIGTVVEANVLNGRLVYADRQKKGQIDPAKETAFLDRVKKVLTDTNASGYMTSEYTGADAELSSKMVQKLHEMVEVLMFIDEAP